MVDTASPDWIADSTKWRGRVLTGHCAHWCFAWDGLPIDETTPEWPCECAQALLTELLAARTKTILDPFVGWTFNEMTRSAISVALRTDPEIMALIDLQSALILQAPELMKPTPPE